MSEHTSNLLVPVFWNTRQGFFLSQLRHTSYVYQIVSKNVEFLDLEQNALRLTLLHVQEKIYEYLIGSSYTPDRSNHEGSFSSCMHQQKELHKTCLRQHKSNVPSRPI